MKFTLQTNGIQNMIAVANAVVNYRGDTSALQVSKPLVCVSLWDSAGSPLSEIQTSSPTQPLPARSVTYFNCGGSRQILLANGNTTLSQSSPNFSNLLPWVKT